MRAPPSFRTASEEDQPLDPCVLTRVVLFTLLVLLVAVVVRHTHIPWLHGHGTRICPSRTLLLVLLLSMVLTMVIMSLTRLVLEPSYSSSAVHHNKTQS